MRTYFKQRLSDDTLLATAYSLESVLIELIFIVGPMLVALFVAAASAAAAVMFAAPRDASVRCSSCARRHYDPGESSLARLVASSAR